MIRSEHSIVHYDFQRMIVRPDRLRRGTDADYLPAAKQMLRIYRDGIGDPRQVLHSRIETCLSRLSGCPPRRIAAFCKLLDDQSEFPSNRNAALHLRRQVFDFAADRHPIVEHREGIFDHELQQVRSDLANAIGRPWPEIEADLFCDVLELQRLKSFESQWTPPQLLSAYNVAQTQAALYRATRVRIDATDDFKTIVRHAKLAGLMHRIDRVSSAGQPRYRFIFDGPQSTLRQSTRYGVRFAALAAKLLACRGWHLTAEILGPRKQRFRMELSPADGLTGALSTPDAFDSSLEAEVDAAWQKAPVDGWTWQRESQLLVRGQSVMTPDFSLHHSARNLLVYVEVIGFWTPEYLEEKCRRLKEFAVATPADSRPAETTKWLLIVSKQQERDLRQRFAELSLPIVGFDKQTKPQSWIDAIDE
ncbi:hypothetical protein Enr13x_05390 [Stieleria neptunia]|uniref:DUF790 family protein n=1 Tax=Stieleria neptunia TaxID=2527979 RepID=A0A518HIR8_9BACT|nr:DUF790 family protein [Stieleria neptunia]QDV40703.1 hypothetical protein Enr13x_05390 [Stieleria neptunia]